MHKVTIFLDPKSPIYDEMEKEVLQYINSLDTIIYAKTVVPSEPGTLNIDVETIKIVADLSTSVIAFITAIMLIISQIQSSMEKNSKEKESGKQKYAEIEIDGLKLTLPVSDESAKKFLRKVAKHIEETDIPKVEKKTGKRKS